MNTFIEVLRIDLKVNFREVYKIGTIKKTFVGLLLDILNRMYRKQSIINDKHAVRSKNLDTLF